MTRTFSSVSDVSAAKIWVMDAGVRYPDDIKPMKDGDLSRVRGVEGVDWAVPFFKSTGRVRLGNGTFETVFVLGLDSATLLGGPSRILEGKLTDLWEPDAVMVDEAGAKRLGGVKVGDWMELNDRRARVVGICRIERTFVSFPVLYTTYTRAISYVPGDRRAMSFVLAAPKAGRVGRRRRVAHRRRARGSARTRATASRCARWPTTSRTRASRSTSA